VLASEPCRYFDSSPEVIGLVMLVYVRLPRSLRNVEDLLFERGSASASRCHGSVAARFGPFFTCDIHRQRVSRKLPSTLTRKANST
jgi:putative transposase